MKSLDNADDGDLYDPIKLNFDVNAPPRLENVEFLDPGIIDLECESDEDIHFIDENTTDNDLLEDATSLDSVITAIPDRVSIKPMNIKLVDCFRFPWYFDQFTKNIIKNKLIISNGLNNSEPIMDISSNNINDVYEVANDNAFGENLGVNETSKSAIDVNSNELSSDSNIWKQAIDINQKRELLGTKLKVFDHNNRLAYTKMKNDLELLNAMSQRNKTGIDIKRNTGLVGMKIKSMTTKKNVGLVGTKIKSMTAERQASDMQCKSNNLTDIVREQIQETNNMYIQAVDKTLIDLGTTIAPVYIDIERHTKENELCKLTVPQDTGGSSRDYFSKKVPKKLKSAKNGTDLKFVSTNRDNAEEEILQKINKTTKIAQEIVRMVTFESGELSQVNDRYKNINKFNKPMPYSKKIEIQPILTHLDKAKVNLKYQKDTKECKSIKIIKPMPHSTRKRNKKKLPKSIKINEVQEKISPIISSSSTPKSNTSITIICNNPHDMEKQETEKSKTSTMIPFKPASPNRRSEFHVPRKSFPTLNKFTENILSKIKAKKKLVRLDKKHSKNYDPNIQSKSTNEQKSMSGVFRTKSSDTNEQCDVRKISEMAISDMHPLDNTAKDGFTDNKGGEKVTRNPEMILTQPQKSKKNYLVPSTIKKLSHSDLHYNSLQNMLPLNTIVMNTAKTDSAKINVDSNSTVKSTFDYATNSNSPGNKSKTVKEHSTTNAIGAIEPQKQSLKILNQEPNTATLPLLDYRFDIQTTTAIQNELDTGEVNHAANNLTYQTHVPKAQVSAITTRPTQKQNYRAETNKPLAVHNSMQSHILYRPQAESRSPSKMFLNNTEALCYQNPVPQINQAPGNSMCYPSWYTELVASLEAIRKSNNGFNGGIPSQTTSNTSKNGNCEKITPKIEMNSTALRVEDGSPSKSIIDAKQTPLGFKGHISPLMEMNVRNNKGILPHAVMNNSPMLTGAIGTVLQETKTETGGNRMIPTHMAFNNKPTPPGACDVQPNTAFWSSTFPPPKLPPPPPTFSPYSQKTKIIPSSKETMSSSILGRNDGAIIKKIKISSQVFDHGTETDSKEPKPNCSLPNVLPVALENCRLATTKSEMLQVLDTSMHRMKSPVEALPFKAKADPNDFKSSLNSPSFERLTNISKNEKPHQNMQPIPSESNKTNYIKQEILPHKTFDEDAAKKKTTPVKPNSNRVNQSKVPQFKCNQSSDLCSAKLLEINPKPVDTSKTLAGTSHHKNIQSKAISINAEKDYTGSKKESPQIEINRKDGTYSRKTNVASPVTLKRALTMDQIEKISTVKYKPGPLSKKIKVFDPRGSPNETKTEQKMLPNRGYSAPILPIPTYEKILSEVPITSNKYFDKPIIELSKNVMSCNKADAKMEGVSNMNSNKPTKRRKYDELITHKVCKAKKISLQEYKNRSASERKRDEALIHNDSFNKKTVDMPRRMSQVDSDLGYDSDSTVKL